jgi:flagellar basal-body rod modification protein FlgD
MPTAAVTGLSGYQPTASSTSTSSTATKTKPGTVGKDDFLKLLTAQLKMQDPSSPTDMTQMTQQMTQFSIVEQLMSLNESMTAQKSATAQSQALALLGKTVTWEAEDGSTQTGVVEHVAVAGGSPVLHIGDKEVAPGQVSSVT